MRFFAFIFILLYSNADSWTVPVGSGYMQWYQKFEYAVGQSLRVFQANNLLTTHESLGIVSKYKIFSLECLQIEFILIE